MAKNKKDISKEETLGPWQIAWGQFKKNKIAVFGLILFTIIVLSVIFVPMIMGKVQGIGENDYDLTIKNLAPGVDGHLLGTDNQGRDIVYRLFLGGRISILVGLFSAVVGVVLGCTIGGIAGFYGGLVDNLLMRFTEIVNSLPFTPLVIVISASLLDVSPQSKVYIIAFLIGILGWPSLARLVRGQILSLREQEYMQACTALGLSDFSKIFKHLIPNVLSIVIVNATLSMASAILTEAALSYLGMGVVAPIPTWGNMMNAAQNQTNFMYYPWIWLPAGILTVLTVVSINLTGEGLRDAFDPKGIR